MPPSSWSRRQFLARGTLGAAGLLAAPALLAACGSSESSSDTTSAAAGGGDLGRLSVQLSWVKSNSFAGIYLADSRGYFADQGFSSVDLLAGGPNVTPDAAIESGKALLGTANTDTTATAILAGADNVIVGSHFLKNPFCVMSLPDDPILEPGDLAGRKIGVSAYNTSVWEAFLTVTGVDPSAIEVVPIQFDPQPLVAGEVQGILGFVNDQPGSLAARGVEVELMMLADFGYQLVQESVVVRRSTLESKRDLVKAFLVADVMGWRDSVADPAAGPELTATVYGKDLGITAEDLLVNSELQAGLVYPPSAAETGIINVPDELIEATIASIALGGVEIEADRLFDMSVIREVYEEHPELLAPIS